MDILLAVATATISYAWYCYCHRAQTAPREYYSAGQRNVSAIITDARVN